MVRLFCCAESYALGRRSLRFRIFGFKYEIEGVFPASLLCCALYPID
jgi:hypothetical protein